MPSGTNTSIHVQHHDAPQKHMTLDTLIDHRKYSLHEQMAVSDARGVDYS